MVFIVNTTVMCVEFVWVMIGALTFIYINSIVLLGDGSFEEFTMIFIAYI